MSISNTHPEGRTLIGGTSAALLAVIGIWRFGVECETMWLRSLNAPPEPWELAYNERALQQLRASARMSAATARAVPAGAPRQPVPA